MTRERRIAFNETSLRGTLQAPHPNPAFPNHAVILTRPQQLEIADGLGQFGIDQIELVSPVDNDFGLVTAQRIVQQNTRYPHTEICVHTRCATQDIDAALATGATRLNAYKGTSEQLRHANHDETIDETIASILTSIDYIHTKSPNTKIRFSTEDGFRTNKKDLFKVIRAVAHSPYVDTIGIPDTTGLAYPNEVYKLIKDIRKLPEMKGKRIEVHFHTDRGMAIANCWMAWLAGAEVVDVSILGLEERNGIPPLTGTVMAFDNSGLANQLEEKYDLKLLATLDGMVAGMLGITIPFNQPGSRSHSKYVAGPHGNGMHIDVSSYQAQNLTRYGYGKPEAIYVSMVIGGNMVLNRLEELGFNMTKEKRMALKQKARETATTLRSIASQLGSSMTLEIVDHYLKDIFKQYFESS